MNEINMLEQELLILLNNIKNVKNYIDINKNEKYTPYKCNVFGELKHRIIALKNSCTKVCKMNTSKLFKGK